MMNGHCFLGNLAECETYHQSLQGTSAWMNNYTHIFPCDVIINPYLNFKSYLAKLPMMLRYHE